MSTATDSTTELARRIRARALRLVYEANASHIGSCLSIADLLAVLYGRVLRFDPSRPEWPERDRFILSKGHAAAALYSVLAECRFFPVEWLDKYCHDGTKLAGHCAHAVPGVEVSTGSLGHGLSIGCGMALAGKRNESTWRVFVLLGDGECNEGVIWEAALFAPQHRLDNLVVVVDHNGLQGFGVTKDVLDLSPFADKWRSFGWGVSNIDGHDPEQIAAAVEAAPLARDRPTVVIAHTIKGRGVSFMENELAWHYRAPDAGQLRQALEELGVDP